MVIYMLKRFLSLYIFFIFCFMVLLGRIYQIGHKDYDAVSTRQSTRTVIVGEKRGEIYDRNFMPLVSGEKKLFAVVTPCPAAYEYLKDKADDEYLRNKIENASPFVIETVEEINNEVIRTFSVPMRYSENQSAVHIIGYTDSTGKSGISGIERAYNNFLSENSGKLTVSFQVDAVGRVLAGMDKYINDNNFTSKAGVVLTLDSKVQSSTETALHNSSIKSGAAVIMKAHTGEIMSMASVPTYDPNNIADYLAAEDSPFINKALMSYSVGSIFKPLVAACAIENGISSEYKYECKGEIIVGDRVFNCYDNKAHGNINMTEALEVSCNCYFVNLINKIDTEHLLSLCKKSGLGRELTLAPGISSAQGILPSEKSHKSKGTLANFAFGQGEFLASPLQIASLYHTLTTGNYISPSLVMGFTNNIGLMTKEKSAEPMKVLSDEAVSLIRKMLKSAGEAYNISGGAGKTGTAQSGVYKNGKEILRTWFAGYYPAENPEYIIVILCENGRSGTADCVPVFKEIIKGLD